MNFGAIRRDRASHGASWSSMLSVKERTHQPRFNRAWALRQSFTFPLTRQAQLAPGSDVGPAAPLLVAEETAIPQRSARSASSCHPCWPEDTDYLG